MDVRKRLGQARAGLHDVLVGARGLLERLGKGRGIMLPVAVGVMALLVGGVFAFVTVRGPVEPQATAGDQSAATAEGDGAATGQDGGAAEGAGPGAAETAAEPAAAKVRTRPLVHRPGGFRVDVPVGMRKARDGRTATLRTKDRTLVVTVGPGERGKLQQATDEFVSILKQEYRKVRLSGSERQRVDGRPALLTAGLATNRNGTRIRFVTVQVRHQPANYAITAYTARDSDPAQVLPKVNAIVNGFEVLTPKRR